MGFPADATPTWKYSYQAIHALRPFVLFLASDGRGARAAARRSSVGLQSSWRPGQLCSGIRVAAPGVLHGQEGVVQRPSPGDSVSAWDRRISYQQGRPRYGRTRAQCESLAGRACTRHVPEGTRNRGMPLRRGRSGVARVALEADVPIVPVAVQGIPHLHQTWAQPL